MIVKYNSKTGDYFTTETLFINCYTKANWEGRMGETTQVVGVGFELVINTETEAFENFYKSLGRTGINYNIEGVHVTLVDSDESTFPILSARDDIALDRLRADGSRYVHDLIANGLTLSPAAHTLEPFGKQKRKMGIVIAEQPVLARARAGLRAIYDEVAGVEIKSDEDYVGHAIIGNRSKKRSTSQGNGGTKERVRIPQNLHVVGFNMTERSMAVAVRRVRMRAPSYRDRKFHHVPTGLGR